MSSPSSEKIRPIPPLKKIRPIPPPGKIRPISTPGKTSQGGILENIFSFRSALLLKSYQ